MCSRLVSSVGSADGVRLDFACCSLASYTSLKIDNDVLYLALSGTQAAPLDMVVVRQYGKQMLGISSLMLGSQMPWDRQVLRCRWPMKPSRFSEVVFSSVIGQACSSLSLRQ